nr:MAG TPA: hypothetical protein [Caudoviricetes sp.]
MFCIYKERFYPLSSQLKDFISLLFRSLYLIITYF